MAERSPSILGQRIREVRVRRGMSQADLAFLSVLDPGVISRCERGVTEPRALSLASIAETLNESADYLLGLTDESRSEALESDPN